MALTSRAIRGVREVGITVLVFEVPALDFITVHPSIHHLVSFGGTQDER